MSEDISLQSIALKNKEKADKYHEEFKKVFGVRLIHYFDFIMGFDIVKFDERIIKTPDGRGMDEYIKEKYGEDAEDMIRELL